MHSSVRHPVQTFRVVYDDNEVLNYNLNDPNTLIFTSARQDDFIRSGSRFES